MSKNEIDRLCEAASRPCNEGNTYHVKQMITSRGRRTTDIDDIKNYIKNTDNEGKLITDEGDYYVSNLRKGDRIIIGNNDFII
jgi:hypothetical protein